MKTTSRLATIVFSILAATPAHPGTPRSYPASEHEHSGAVRLETYDEVCRIVAERFFGPRLRGVNVAALCAAGRDPRMDRALTEAVGLTRTDHSTVILFVIEANTVPCEGLVPRRCLVVNGEYFYGVIDGYRHVEGRPARIYVERSKRPEPVPADVGDFVYRRVAGPRQGKP